MTISHRFRTFRPPAATISRRLATAVAHASRLGSRMRRRAQIAGERLADRLRPAEIDGRDLGRLVAAMAVSGSFIALLLFALTALVAVLYAPLARDALRAMGFEV